MLVGRIKMFSDEQNMLQPYGPFYDFDTANFFFQLRGRILGNPFLAGPYIIKRKCCQNFILVGSAVLAVR